MQEWNIKGFNFHCPDIRSYNDFAFFWLDNINNEGKYISDGELFIFCIKMDPSKLGIWESWSHETACKESMVEYLDAVWDHLGRDRSQSQ